MGKMDGFRGKTCLMIASAVLGFLFLLSSCSSGSRVLLRYAGLGDPNEFEIMEKAISMFEKRAGVKVKFVHIPGEGYWVKLQTMIAGNEAPDVMYVNGEFLAKMAGSGVFYDLSDLVDWSKFYSKAVRDYTFRGRKYAIPRDVAPLILFYNRALFERFGVPLPDESWGWKEFLRAAKALTRDTDGDGAIDTYGYAVWNYYTYWLPFLWASGVDLISSDGKRCLLNTKPAVKALSDYFGLITKYRVSPSLEAWKDTPLFDVGRLGMVISGYWTIPQYSKSLGDDLAFALPPKYNGRRYVYMSSAGYAVSSVSKHKKEAVELAKFLAGEEVQRMNAERRLSVPSLKSLTESHWFLSLEPYNRYFAEAMKYARSPKYVPQWSEVVSRVKSGLDPVFVGRATVDQVVDKITEEVNRILQGEM